MKLKKLFIMTATTMILSSCASIVSDSKYPVTINSSPSGARFEVISSNGVTVHSGRTPSQVVLKSGDGYFSSASYKVKFTKTGFEEGITQIQGEFDGWYIGNFLFGGLMGLFIVDPLTGAMWQLPDQTNVSLTNTPILIKPKKHEIVQHSINAEREKKESQSRSIISINDLTEDEKIALITKNRQK